MVLAACESGKKVLEMRTDTYKGRLEFEDNCGNKIISFLDSTVSAVNYDSFWIDKKSGKIYYHVFKSHCLSGIPKQLKSGDIFLFSIRNVDRDCIEKLGCAPPGKTHSIQVLKIIE